MKKTNTNFRSGIFFVALIFLMFSFYTIKSQCAATNNWDVTSLNSSSNTQSYDIARDASGNIFMCGTFETAATFTSTCGFSSTPVNVSMVGSGPLPKSAYIAKFDCGGKLLWVNYECNSLGWSEGRTLVVDPAGTYVFLSGAASGTLNFRAVGSIPCASGPTAPNFVTTEYYVARFNTSNGAFIDAYAPTVPAGASYTVNSMALKKTISGGITNYNFYVCGSAIFGGTDQNFFVHNVLLSSSAGYSLPWAKNAVCIGGHHNQAWDIEYNPVSDLVFFTGDFDYQMQFPATGSTCVWTKVSLVDGFVGAVDATTGTPYCIHCKELGASVGEYGTGRALAVDAGGDMYYTGAFTGTLTTVYQGGSTILAGASGRYAMFVTRRNSTPSMVWRNRILPVTTGNCAGMGIAINTSSVYVSGSFDGGNLVFPGGGGTYTAPGKRMFISTFNRTTSGLVAGNTSKSSDPNSDHLTEKVTCDDYYAYTCGSYKGIFDYTTGSPPWGILNSTPALTNQNSFVVRNGSGATNPFRFANTENENLSSGIETNVSIYPNPTNSELNIQLQYSDSETILEIKDISGKLILSKNVLHSENEKLDLSKYDSGIYFLNIKSANITTRRKIIKN
jgi:hypothetical protein